MPIKSKTERQSDTLDLRMTIAWLDQRGRELRNAEILSAAYSFKLQLERTVPSKKVLRALRNKIEQQVKLVKQIER